MEAMKPTRFSEFHVYLLQASWLSFYENMNKGAFSSGNKLELINLTKLLNPERVNESIKTGDTL
jgi:hypothetical protein